jgi:inhibitor of KinA sporulation pathway (predicted exonuclease)
LEWDCALRELDSSGVASQISLRHQYGAMKTIRRVPGLLRALQSENTSLEGTHRRGIDEARKISKLFLW